MRLAIDRFSRRDSFAAALAFMPSPQAVTGTTAGGSVRSVTEFGAKGDGRTDDTEAFRKALANAPCVLVPPCPDIYRITRTLALGRRGQRVVGFGAASRIRLDPSDQAQANLFVTDEPDTAFVGLNLVQSPLAPSLFEGWGIAAIGARRLTVQGCMFSGMRRGGVLLSDSDDCRVQDNVFLDSLVKGDGSERQAATGYDIFMAGTASRNMIVNNQCLSGVGTGIGCQTVTPGKVQNGNIIRGNVIRNQPCYGIMVYLSDTHDRLEPNGRIDAIMIESNDIADISGSIFSDDRTIFFGCGIYLQTTNDIIVTGNRIVRTNKDRRLPFSGSAVPAAIGISGYGNAVVASNIVDGCHHGIASIQTTARPRRGDGTIISDNLVRNCDGAGIWLGDCVAATVHDNRLTAAQGKGTHGILVRRFDSDWMQSFAIRGNEICDFAVGIEVGGDAVSSAELSSNRVTGNSGNAIHSSALTTLVHHNQIEGRYGISLAPGVERGFCRDNIIQAGKLAITDDGGSGLQVENNIVPAGKSFSSSICEPLPRGPTPKIPPKRWLRKVDSATITGLEGGYEGQEITILAEGPFSIENSASIRLRSGQKLGMRRGEVITFVYLDNAWRETS